jgi:hypothetical protein
VLTAFSLPVDERTAPRRAARDLDAVTVKITADGADARPQLNREILDPDALHDVSLPQIVLQAVKAQTAGPQLPALANARARSRPS